MRDATLSATGGRTRFPTVRRRRRLSLVTAALFLLTGPGAVIVSDSRQSAHAASDDRHFILITAKGGPAWSAKGRLFTSDGTLVCQKEVPKEQCEATHARRNTWETETKHGGRELWRFNVDEGGTIDVTIYGPLGIKVLEKKDLEGDRSHCFLVAPFGNARHTGDSLTGGCTPD